MYAVRHADIDVVRAVVLAFTNLGGDINHTDNFGNTALFHYAPRIDNANIGRALVLADGINITAVNTAGENILEHAINHNNVSLVSDIISFHGSSDGFDKFYNHTNEGNTPLILAAQLGRTEIVNLLITQTRVNPYAINHRGRSAFMEAARFGHADVLRALYDRYGINEDGSVRSPQYSAIDIESEINADYVDAYDSSGASALLVAAEQGHSEAVEFLLDIGANPNIESCLPVLLVCRGTGNTPLLYAVRNNDVSVFLPLAHAGADYDLANNDGITPLILAASLGNRTAAKSLLVLGADYSLRDDNGLSALEHARSQNTHNHREIVRLIRERITGL